LSVRLRGVPFAQDLQYLAVLATGATGCSIALVDTAVCRMAEGHTLAGGALNAVTLDRAEPVQIARAPAGLDQSALMLMGATARSVETAGALEARLSDRVASGMGSIATGSAEQVGRPCPEWGPRADVI
jgi:acyl-CoA dehydrogenase